MIEHRDCVPISLTTFRSSLAPGEYAELEDALGYTALNIRLHGDYHVRAYRSVFEKRPCVYLVHSSVEYVFV